MEENQMVSDQPTESVSDIQTEQKQDTVKYETYRKTVGEVKKYKGAVQEKDSRIQELEDKLNQLEGDKDARIEYLTKQLNEKSTKLSEVNEVLEFSSVSQKVEQEALKQNCVDTNALMTFFNEDDWKSLRGAGDDLTGDDVNEVIERVKKRHPKVELFKAPKVNHSHVNPARVEKEKKQKPFTEMTVDELREYRTALAKKGVNIG